jgi:hypothetical protein
VLHFVADSLRTMQAAYSDPYKINEKLKLKKMKQTAHVF